MPESEEAIHAIAERVRARHTNASTCLDTQILCLAEEVGEAVQAYRRATGRARSAGTWGAVAEELADVVIVSYVTAAIADIDLDAAVTAKLKAIADRGGI